MKKMKIKTACLIGKPLDYAVCLALGPIHGLVRMAMLRRAFYPSTDWSDGGPIIERERIRITPMSMTGGVLWQAESGSAFAEGLGPTLLVAAMRAFVASKLGDEVEVPQKVVIKTSAVGWSELNP